MESLDLRDIFGEDHLAHALGVGTGTVGAVWGKLMEHPVTLRASVLDNLAMNLEGDYTLRSLDGDSDNHLSELEQLARKHGISPNVVEPLVSYYRTITPIGIPYSVP